MHKAIISGASGLIGSTVTRELLSHGIKVLALGRKHWKDIEPNKLVVSNNLQYMQIEMSDIHTLPSKIREIAWDPGRSVFYNFAWSGVNRLTDGDVEDQIKNVTFCSKAIEIAKEIGCKKFVNAGSIEETFAERYLAFDVLKRAYHSTHDIYAISKLGARDLCKMVAYLKKIDYVHTRLSVPIDMNLTPLGYVSSVLHSILNGEDYDSPSNGQLFDLTPLEDIANAYYLIGQNGKNKADYFIGTGKPNVLSNYFAIFQNIVEGKDRDNIEYPSLHELLLTKEDFSIDDLVRDTGFTPTSSFEDFSKKVVKS